MKMQTYKMIYKIEENNNDLRILGDKFVNNNHNKVYLIVKNKKSKLKDIITIQNKKIEELKIKMILLDKIYNRYYMFKDCEYLLNISINNRDDYENLKNSDIIEYEEKETIFDNLNNNTNFENYDFYNFSNDETSSFINTSEIKSEISQQKKLKSDNSTMNDIANDIKINIINIDDYYVTLKGMFKNCNSLTYISNIFTGTYHVFDISEIFSGCSSITSLPDISNFDTQNSIDMNFAFSDCSSLKLLPDISKWNTINNESMKSLFKNCSSLESLPDISKWNIENVYDISELFYDCKLIYF